MVKEVEAGVDVCVRTGWYNIPNRALYETLLGTCVVGKFCDFCKAQQLQRLLQEHDESVCSSCNPATEEQTTEDSEGEQTNKNNEKEEQATAQSGGEMDRIRAL